VGSVGWDECDGWDNCPCNPLDLSYKLGLYVRRSGVVNSNVAPLALCLPPDYFLVRQVKCAVRFC
jgi:hypothetical protein